MTYVLGAIPMGLAFILAETTTLDFTQLGVSGTCVAIAIVAWTREHNRANKLADQLEALHTKIEERTLPALAVATSSVSTRDHTAELLVTELHTLVRELKPS